ncbi:MAG TPA: magnesium/cobalt transporter CorA [Actinomycetota bacterium]
MRSCRVFRDGASELVDPDEVDAELAPGGALVWLDVVEPDADDLDLLASRFPLHGLSLEDIDHRDQRPRVEPYEGYVFVSLRPIALPPEPADGPLEVSEVHAIVSDDALVTVRFEPPFDLAEVDRRITSRPDLVEGGGTAAMLYALVDSVVDGYLDVVDRFEKDVEAVGEAILEPEEGGLPVDEIRRRLHRQRVDLATFRRHVSPMRRAVEALLERPDVVGEALVPYYRDVADHVLRALDFADNVRDVLTSLTEVRVAQQANELNEVMKKLTAWAGIILVPTLIAGIYGMNFRHMPELGWSTGYPSALGLMALSALALYVAFRRKGWL